MTPTPQQVERAKAIWMECRIHSSVDTFQVEIIASALAAESAEAEQRTWEAAAVLVETLWPGHQVLGHKHTLVQEFRARTDRGGEGR